MTTSSEDAGSDLAETVQALLGLTLDDVRLLSDRAIADAADLLARHGGPACALALLDAAHRGEESLTLADARVSLLLEAGRHTEAVAAARARLARKESLAARLCLARALLNAGAVDEAADAAATMLEAAPEKVTPLYAAGLVALARQRTGEARAYFQRLLQLHADSPTGLRGLARVALAEGDAGAALELAVQALDGYAEAPPDLVREVQLYAARLHDEELGASARRRIDAALAASRDAQAAREAAVRERLAEELAQVREGGERMQPSRKAAHRSASRSPRTRPPPSMGNRSAAAQAADDEAEQVAALPPAPPPDPAAHEGLVATLRDTFGHDAFRAGQEQVIAAVLNGHDTVAVMPTGAGKSLCYQLPALLRTGVTLVISPLIALMKDQVESLPPALLAQTTLVNSSLESAELNMRLGAIAAGRYRLVYAAPERLRQRPFVHALARAGVGLVVIDEAHCLSMWGHDFRPDYLFIRAALTDLGSPQVLAMTATATPEMMHEVAAQLGRDLCAVNTGVLRDNLFLVTRRTANEDHKLRLVLPFVRQHHGAGIIYVASREMAERLEKQLRQAGVNARAYHAGMGPAERNALQDRFMSGQVRVMVATVAFGMGVDKDDVRFIVHYNPPRSLEAYSQESGRAGRDGRPAVCLLLHSSADRANLNRWSREDSVDLDGLRAVYRALRGLVRGRQGLVDIATLREQLETEGRSEVDLRVAVSILENAGLLRRGPDVPRGATVVVRDGVSSQRDDPRWDEFVRLARLEVARPAPIDLAALARGLDLDVVALEDRLLGWQDEERLTYRGVGREMLIELVPLPADVAERMAAILERMGRRNRRRLRALLAYLDIARCRHAFIARHFGHDGATRCRRCDVCHPVELQELQPVAAARLDDPAEALRRLVAQFPLGFGKPGIIEVLKGATARRLHAGRTDLFGSLAHVSKASIARTVDDLLARGELVVEQRDGYSMLRLAQEPVDAGY